MSECVLANPVEDYPDAAFDMVTAIDVIEHVEDDKGFLGHLLRIAKRYVFISTPNWFDSGCQNPYHVREYTPAEFRKLLAGLCCRYWISGTMRVAVEISSLRDDEHGRNLGVLITKSE